MANVTVDAAELFNIILKFADEEKFTTHFLAYLKQHSLSNILRCALTPLDLLPAMEDAWNKMVSHPFPFPSAITNTKVKCSKQDVKKTKTSTAPKQQQMGPPKKKETVPDTKNASLKEKRVKNTSSRPIGRLDTEVSLKVKSAMWAAAYRKNFNMCEVQNCEYCLRAYFQIPVTRCSSFHRRSDACNTSGFSVHLTKVNRARVHNNLTIDISGYHNPCVKLYRLAKFSSRKVWDQGVTPSESSPLDVVVAEEVPVSPGIPSNESVSIIGDNGTETTPVNTGEESTSASALKKGRRVKRKRASQKSNSGSVIEEGGKHYCTGSDVLTTAEHMQWASYFRSRIANSLPFEDRLSDYLAMCKDGIPNPVVDKVLKGTL